MLTGGYLPRYNNVTIMIRKKNDCKSKEKEKSKQRKKGEKKYSFSEVYISKNFIVY